MYTIALVGKARTGKTAFLERHATGEFVGRYKPTAGMVTTQLGWSTTRGEYTVNVIDCEAGIIPVGVDMYMLFISSLEDVKEWSTLSKIVPESSIMVLQSFCDLRETKYVLNDVPRGDYIARYRVSARSNYRRPFLSALRYLTRDPHLAYIEDPTL